MITSIREQLGAEFVRPQVEKMEEMKLNLTSNEEAMRYLTLECGLSEDTIKHFGIGFDNKGRIAIPNYRRGELISVKYRDIKTGKYSIDKNSEAWVFNEDGLQKGLASRGVLIVEGELDLMSVWQAGITNVISPANKKEEYGMWIEYLDNIPKVYICYDSDKNGKESSMKMAQRVGVDKTLEILLPDEVSLREYFKKSTREDFRELTKNARPFYSRQFVGIGDILKNLRSGEEETTSLEHIPGVLLEKNWVVVVSGVTNIGKTSYVMNLADELTRRKIPTLVLPFERGIESVGKRFLQVKFDIPIGGFSSKTEDDWARMVDECIELPAYFALPKKEQVVDTVVRSKRLFDTRVVIIDHMDYLIRSSNNKEAEIGNTLQNLKRVAEEHDIIFIIVTHIRKIESPGGWVKDRKPGIEDLKGSSSLYQDPEVVVMLSNSDDGNLFVDVQKNKGEMQKAVFRFERSSGKLKERIIDAFDEL